MVKGQSQSQSGIKQPEAGTRRQCGKGGRKGGGKGQLWGNQGSWKKKKFGGKKGEGKNGGGEEERRYEERRTVLNLALMRIRMINIDNILINIATNQHLSKQ